jgi:hypothetical protein
VDGRVSPRHPRAVGACLPGGHPAPGHGRAKGGAEELIPLTVPEVRRLLLTLTEPPPNASASAWPGRPFAAGTKRSPGAAMRRAAPANSPTRQGRSRSRSSARPPVMTDARWARIAPLLPPQKPSPTRVLRTTIAPRSPACSGWRAPELPSAICRRTSVPGKRCTTAITAGARPASGRRSSRRSPRTRRPIPPNCR